MIGWARSPYLLIDKVIVQVDRYNARLNEREPGAAEFTYSIRNDWTDNPFTITSEKKKTYLSSGT